MSLSPLVENETSYIPNIVTNSIKTNTINNKSIVDLQTAIGALDYIILQGNLTLLTGDLTTTIDFSTLDVVYSYLDTGVRLQVVGTELIGFKQNTLYNVVLSLNTQTVLINDTINIEITSDNGVNNFSDILIFINASAVYTRNATISYMLYTSNLNNTAQLINQLNTIKFTRTDNTTDLSSIFTIVVQQVRTLT